MTNDEFVNEYNPQNKLKQLDEHISPSLRGIKGEVILPHSHTHSHSVKKREDQFLILILFLTLCKKGEDYSPHSHSLY